VTTLSVPSTDSKKFVRRKRAAILIAACAAAVIAAFSFLAVFRYNFQHPYAVFIGSYLAAFAACIGAAFFLMRFSSGPVSEGGDGARKYLLLFAVIAAIAFRIVLLFGPEDNDIYRALWEGRVIRAGYSPYTYAPDSDKLRDPVNPQFPLSKGDPHWPNVDHRSFPSFFPPFTLSLITSVGWISYSPAALKILFTLFDLGTIAVLFLMLQRRRAGLFGIVLYAWNPVVLSAFALGGHPDSILVFFLALAAALLERKKDWAAFLALGFAVVSNFIALLVIPVFLIHSRNRKAAINLIWPCLPGLLSLFAGGANIVWTFMKFGGSPYFHWNDSLHFVLSGFNLTHAISVVGRVLSAIGFIAVYVLILRRRIDAIRATVAVLVSFMLFSPTVQPWFLTWFAPFLCLIAARPWLLWTGTVAVFYAVWGIAVARGGEAQDLVFVKLIEYIPVYALLAWEFLRMRKGIKKDEV
jgi:hypothetical protein